jgi:putative ABC transport system substrate-binding protein
MGERVPLKNCGRKPDIAAGPKSADFGSHRFRDTIGRGERTETRKDCIMQRRDFITLLSGAAASWPFAARAQQSAGMRAIGFLGSGSPEAYPTLLAAYRKGLAEAGYVEGRNVATEYRWAEGKFDRLPELASDLVRRSVSAIATTGTTSALAAKAATAIIPIVFLGGDDPVKFGLVASLSRPGGNATGLNLLTSEMTGKRLELARELLPAAGAIAVLVNPKSPEAEPQLRDVQTAARAIGQPIDILNASTERDVDDAFVTLVQRKNVALLVTNDAFFIDRSAQIVTLAAGHAIPAIYDRRAYAAAGGLISYGTHYIDAFRQLGVYTARILNGTKPADLPVEQSTKFELVINIKTARTLGLDVPVKLISLADELIE